jgi:hypothetical protein
MPFDQIHCADMRGWNGDLNSPGWRKVVASVADLIGDRTSVGRTLNSMTAPTDERKPVTVLFTDLVESTERAARSISHQGDARSIQAALNITVPFHRHVPRSGLHRPRANDLVGAQLIDGA